MQIKIELDFISSIWNDDFILRLDKNNLKYFCCNKKFQGIKATKFLDSALKKRVFKLKVVTNPWGKPI